MFSANKDAVGSIETLPSNGILGMSGVPTYSPNSDFCGIDTFVYTLSSADSSDSATVTITVTCSPTSNPATSTVSADQDQNILPIETVRANGDSLLISQDSGMNVIDVLDNDDSTAGGLVVVAIVKDAEYGTCVVHERGQSVAYTPDSGSLGNDSCTYEACDINGVCDSASVSISIINPSVPRAFTASMKAQEGDNEGESSQAHKASSIIGVCVGATIAFAATWGFIRRRRKGSDGNYTNLPGPWLKSPNSFSTDGHTEASSPPTGNSLSIGQSREIRFGEGENISVHAFLTGEAGSPENLKPRALSPSESLFSVRSSSSSKRDCKVDDVVDL